MTPTLYSIYTNIRYAGRIIELITPDGPIYGRTMFDPDVPPVSTGNEYDLVPPGILGMDGNIYEIRLQWDGSNYLVELVRWATTWGGEEPPSSSVVASASVGAVEPYYYRRATGAIVPGGSSVQAFFQPHVPNESIVLVFSPDNPTVILYDCAIPYPTVIGQTAAGYIIADGGASI